MRKNMGLYRGKRTGDGEWVEGYLTYRYRYDQQSRKEILGPVIDCPQEVTLGNTTGKVICSYQVVPGTEGQFTGLSSHGVKIFEGDIVKAKVIQNLWSKTREYTAVFVVAYHQRNCYFYLKREGNNLLFDGNWSYGVFINEVVGNIHDNPELLTKNSAIDSPSDNP